jgi:hypothetical protein
MVHLHRLVTSSRRAADLHEVRCQRPQDWQRAMLSATAQTRDGSPLSSTDRSAYRTSHRDSPVLAYLRPKLSAPHGAAVTIPMSALARWVRIMPRRAFPVTRVNRRGGGPLGFLFKLSPHNPHPRIRHQLDTLPHLEVRTILERVMLRLTTVRRRR